MKGMMRKTMMIRMKMMMSRKMSRVRKNKRIEGDGSEDEKEGGEEEGLLWVD